MKRPVSRSVVVAPSGSISIDEPARLVLRAQAKINLALDLIGPRDDGYTEIATVFQSIALHDEIGLTWDPDGRGLELVVQGEAGCRPEENLVLRAARAFLAGHPAADRGKLWMTLRKQVPIGAGLGGGSSDAASVLFALQHWFGRPPGARLEQLAERLGADVPFFLTLGCALGEGRGDRISPLPDLSPCFVVLASAGGPLATAAVFNEYKRTLTAGKPTPKISRLLRHLRDADSALPPVWNDLTPAATLLRPVLGRLIADLVSLGAVAEMSGSGSVVFGLFARQDEAHAAAATLRNWHPEAWVETTTTLTQAEARDRRVKGGEADWDGDHRHPGVPGR